MQLNTRRSSTVVASCLAATVGYLGPLTIGLSGAFFRARSIWMAVISAVMAKRICRYCGNGRASGVWAFRRGPSASSRRLTGFLDLGVPKLVRAVLLLVAELSL
jgi:hypothetical protein